MTSKQALKDLIDEIKYTHNDGKTLTPFDQKRVDVIAKDLEVLEIIKSHIINKTFIMGSDYAEYNTIQFEVDIKELKPYIQENIKCTPITICNNSFTLIKEWLEENNNYEI